MFSTLRVSLIAISLGHLALAADAARWVPGKVVAVEQVNVPAREPDPDCHTIPRGESLPARCRPANLKAEQYWKVTVETGTTRYMVRPYRAPRFIDSLNQTGPIYLDPKLTAGSAVEVAVYPNKSIRIRTDKGDGLPAIVDSEDPIVGAQVPTKTEAAPAPRVVAAQTQAPVARTAAPAAVPAGAAKVVLLENGDFTDLEAQVLKAQDIGDGAVLYSFSGDSSPVRAGSNKPVFLITEGGAGRPELARLQVGKGTRQLLYSATKKRSASPLAVTVTAVSDTIQRVTVSEPLAPGEYVILLEAANRVFLFAVK